MELEPDSKDKIQKLQSNIREELKTVEEKKLKLKKKTKKLNQNPNVNINV
mgnify:CR=1 FL=1